MTHQTYQLEERAGIWIDHKTAYLVKIGEGQSTIIETIYSGIYPADVSPQDEKMYMKLAYSIFNNQDQGQKSQQHELNAYYKVIINRLREIDYVYLFGPGEAKHRLNREIVKEGKNFPCKILEVEPSYPMTQNELQLKVTEYYSSARYADTIRKLGFGPIANGDIEISKESFGA